MNPYKYIRRTLQPIKQKTYQGMLTISRDKFDTFGASNVPRDKPSLVCLVIGESTIS